MNKYYFYIVYFFFIILLLELTSYALFLYKYGQKYKLQVEDLLNNTKSYTWNDKYNIIMLIPGLNIKSFFFDLELQDNFKVNEYN
jgi:hypothetical protein